MTTTDLTPVPTDLSPAEAEERGRRAYELDQQVKQGIREGREALWRTAQALYDFSEMSGWSALGHDTLAEWLADPEVSMTRSTYHRMVSVWRELVVLRKLPESEVHELEASKVDIVLPAVKAGRVTLKKALKDVRALGARDLRDEYLKRPDVPPDVQVRTGEDVPDPSSYMDPPVNDGTDQATVASTGEEVPTSGVENGLYAGTPKTTTGPVDAADDPDAFQRVINGDLDDTHASEMITPGGVIDGSASEPGDITHGAEGYTDDERAYINSSSEAPSVPQEATEAQGMPQALRDAITTANDALAQPQRLAGSRQAVRESLANLIAVLEEHFQ
jgi:hypothetical protein